MINPKYMKMVVDPFDVHIRVRDFVPSWRIYWNRLKQRYEVHDIDVNSRITLVAVLPFDQIDQRTIDYLAKHRVNNLGKIIQEIEENNADVLRRQFQQNASFIEDIARKHF